MGLNLSSDQASSVISQMHQTWYFPFLKCNSCFCLYYSQSFFFFSKDFKSSHVASCSRKKEVQKWFILKN